uniref:NADH-ubiquinone oxidoreductase chain 4 n=1 Tax=Placida sp. 1 NY-2013 TaxID=1281821 RepID=L7UZE8_9GAST|nr:NADH dehydrogenase subunit 4 [Placida sp. 1 NY-2013]AGC56265.1 NADH dehydrogenase subunit 4 [Placida sp. 1 NY-2013]
MLSLIYGLLVLPLFLYWGTTVVSFTMITLLSVLFMYQSFSSSFNLIFSMSSLSSFLIVLSLVLCLLSFISTPSSNSFSYSMTICLLGGFLILAFSSSNVINFYIWFEASLIPTLILIICWGYQPERLQAGTYMMLYTVGASLPLLLVLIWRCVDGCSTNLFFLSLSAGDLVGAVLIFIYGAFLVKLPMYGTHLWLPKAHVEAPLAGSMILAGILLKLGGFGLFQMNKCFSLCSSFSISFFLVCVSLWGGLLAVMACMRQVDVKAYVAYSSVGHMGLVSAGVILDRTWGVSSALITMVAHGFASSALFCLAFFTYEKSHSRSMPYMKGILKLYPILSLWWFLFCCINMAAPPTINLLGEMMIIPATWFSYWGLAVVMSVLVFFSAAYNMYLYGSINHGDSSRYLTSGSSMGCHEGVSLTAHLIPLVIIFKSSVFLI